MDQQRKVLLVTGGATGMGRAVVEKFYKEGWNVSFCDCNTKAAEEVCALDPERLHFVEVDVKQKAQLEAWAQQAFERFGSVDGFFANAGIHRSNTLLGISEEELKLMIDTNLYGTIHALQAVVPHMMTSGGGAIVINDSDQFYIGKPHSFGYGLTKGALGQMTRSLAIDLAPHKIRVNAVCPSTIRTPLSDNALQRYADSCGKTLDEAWDEENQLFLRGKAGTAEEAAEMVFFLIEKGTFCTGAHYLVDGGLVAG